MIDAFGASSGHLAAITAGDDFRGLLEAIQNDASPLSNSSVPFTLEHERTPQLPAVEKLDST